MYIDTWNGWRLPDVIVCQGDEIESRLCILFYFHYIIWINANCMQCIFMYTLPVVLVLKNCWLAQNTSQRNIGGRNSLNCNSIWWNFISMTHHLFMHGNNKLQGLWKTINWPKTRHNETQDLLIHSGNIQEENHLITIQLHRTLSPWYTIETIDPPSFHPWKR